MIELLGSEYLAVVGVWVRLGQQTDGKAKMGRILAPAFGLNGLRLHLSMLLRYIGRRTKCLESSGKTGSNVKFLKKPQEKQIKT